MFFTSGPGHVNTVPEIRMQGLLKISGKVVDLIRKPSLRLSISSIFIGLFILMISTIIIFTYYNNSNSILKISHQLLQKNAEIVVEKTSNHLDAAAILTRLQSIIYEKNILNIRQGEKIKSMSIETLRRYPQIREFYFGTVDGNNYGAERRDSGYLNRYQITRSNRNDKMGVLLYQFVNSEDKLVKVERKLREYDPRLRPWYKGAVKKGGIYLTDVFLFITDKMQMGITVSHPLYDRNKRLLGVLAADLEIEELSHFMKQLQIGKTGFGFIMDENNQLIAYPDFSRISVKKSGQVRLKKVSELGLDWLTNALEMHRKSGKEVFTVDDEKNGMRKIISFVSFPPKFGKKWKIVLTVPEDDFTSSMKSTNRYSLLISLAILFLALFLISRISKSISKPISLLTDETNKIRNFDLDAEFKISSPIIEIQLISNSIAKLKSGIRAFMKYVPATLVRQLIDTGEEVKLGGRKEELTIFFSDIKGFTSISEELAPEELMVHLSEYLDQLTRIIIECRGTVDKYIGDAIMAFWGAPLKNQQHALDACRAAVLCQKKIITLNNEWRGLNKPIMETRIGLHSGDTIVGNVGSSERMNYSLIGDSVNLASRLEGTNSIYGTTIIISESTYEKVKENFICRPLDSVIVKGKSQAIDIYELIDFIE